MNVLVTGAGGFLGRYIAELLAARGDHVRTFSRKQYHALEELGAETIRGDIRDAAAVANACADIDCVFHVAGVAGIAGPWNWYYDINTLGTRHVIAGCREHHVRGLVYTSSPSVTFDGRDQLGVDESAPYPRHWLCHYPHSKALAEQAVLAADDPEGLRTCSLRPHLIWGPRDQHLVPRLIDRARRGQLRRVGEGANLIDTIHVVNAAQAHCQAADALFAPDARAAGKAYFLRQGTPVNCWNWINELLAVAQLPPVHRTISLRAAWHLGHALEHVHHLLRRPGEPRMTRFLAAQLGRSHYFDISRARRDLGYEPLVSTDEGMKQLAGELIDC